MILKLSTPLAIVALALNVFASLVSATDEETDWNQILVSAPTATHTSQPVTLTCQGGSCRADICPAAVTSGHLEDFKQLFGLARLYGGIHYRNTIEVSWTQGEAIAQNVIDHFYTRRGRDGRDYGR